MKKNAKRGLIFKSDDQKTSEFLEKHPEMYINFTNDVLEALENPDAVHDEDMKRIIGHIEPYYKERKRNEQLYAANASILRENAKKDDSLNSLRNLVDSLKKQNTKLGDTVETLKAGYINQVTEGATDAEKLMAAISAEHDERTDLGKIGGEAPKTAAGDITDEYGELTGESVLIPHVQEGGDKKPATGDIKDTAFIDIPAGIEGPKRAPDVIYMSPLSKEKSVYETALEDLDNIDGKLQELLTYINDMPSALSETEPVEQGGKAGAYKPKSEARKAAEMPSNLSIDQKIKELYEIRKAYFVGNRNGLRTSADEYSKGLNSLGIDVLKYSSLSDQVKALKSDDLERKTRERELALTESKGKLQTIRDAHFGINPNGTTTDIGTYTRQMKGIGIDVTEHSTREEQLAALGIGDMEKAAVEAPMTDKEYKAMFRKNGIAGRAFKEDFSNWKDSRGV